MLGWALAFLLMATIAAFLGFGGAFAAAGYAQFLFVLFFFLFVLSVIAAAGRHPPNI